jgi:P27 family predicted phage terminase small subunit
MGRPPKPPEVHERSGAYAKNPQRRRTDLPPPLEGEPIKPCEVADSEVASQAWDRIAGILREMRLLSASYTDALVMYATSYARWHECREAVATDGMIVDGKRHPLMPEITNAQDRCQKILNEMGLTPVSRAKVSVPNKTETADPVLEMLARMQRARENA